MEQHKQHWDQIFQKVADERMGWFESGHSQTMKFLNLIPGWETSRIFIPGVGTSGIIDVLMKTDSELILNDISSTAMELVKKRYVDQNNKIQWICQDISEELPIKSDTVDIWFDRAVLHFLTDEQKIEGYFGNVTRVLKAGGFALFSEFSKTGAVECAGLKVKQYDAEELTERLPDFELTNQENYLYTMPNGEVRPYIYALLEKK